MEPFQNPTPGLDSQWPDRGERPRIDLQTLIEPVWDQALLWTESRCQPGAWPIRYIRKKYLLRERMGAVVNVNVADMFPAPRELTVSLGHIGWDRRVGSDSSSASDCSWPSCLSLSNIGSSVTLKIISCWDINTTTNNNSSHRGRNKHTNISCTC